MYSIEQVGGMLSKGEAALVLSPQNRRYLTGFPSSAGCVLVTSEKSYFLTDFRYMEAASLRIRHMECIEYKRMSESINQLLGKHDIKRIYIESDYMTIDNLSMWQKSLPNQTIITEPKLNYTLQEMRAIKSHDELDKIRQAQQLTEYGFDYILDFIKPGKTEREIALELEFAIRKQGADGASFDFIVVSGVNSSMPHGVPTDKPVENGDFVTMDFGAIVDGWHSDMTRTVAVGSVSEEQKKVYDLVLNAQLTALSVLKAGITGQEADSAARDLIDKAGYGHFFGHGTGHGVGLDIHEDPRLSTNASDVFLKSGMVVTVEPGIYLPGKFGVRIEDMAVITQNGYENLTNAAKELIII